jgi:uncharacterized protein (TIGR02001 family)
VRDCGAFAPQNVDGTEAAKVARSLPPYLNMEIRMKNLLVGLSLAVVAAASSAQVTTNFSLTTNYKYRGQDQTLNKPALQGGFDYAMGGFYVGNWNSSSSFADASIEMDFYGGYKGEIAKGLGFDVGALTYYYPQRVKNATEPNTTEIYGGLSFGPATAKLSYTISDEYFGYVNGDGTLYLDLSANYEVVKGLTLNAHVGATKFSSDAKTAAPATAVNYVDYKLGATYDLGSGFSGGAHFVGANKKNVYGDINKARVILTITKAM